MRSADVSISDARLILRRIPLFADLSEASLLVLARWSKFERVKKGQFIFRAHLHFSRKLGRP
jgi:hypothetical protein